MKFKDFKNEIIEKAVKASACQDELDKALDSSNYMQLLEVIKNNITFCIYDMGLDVEFFKKVKRKTLIKSNIYIDSDHEVKVSKNTLIITLGSSSATIKTWDSSSATIKTWGSSSATIETWDSSSATIKTLGSSSATIKTLGSSSATIKTWDSSSATIKTLDSSSIEKENKGDYSVILDLDSKTVIISNKLKVEKVK